MKYIKLSQGKRAMVDNDDYDYLMLKKWSAYPHGRTWYAKTWDGVIMHRHIMKTPKGKDTHHINGNGLDNRKNNLSIISHHMNVYLRRGANIGNISKIRGVTYHKTHKVWCVSLCWKYKNIWIGQYKTLSEAKKAMKEARTKLEIRYL